ncbi:MAG: PfkB family carbohydrate kinase, partial [Haliscomenobacter sp.]
HNQGVPVRIISRIGTDALGEEIVDFITSNGCHSDWIQKDTHLGTGIVKVHATASGANSYEIVQPVAWDAIELTPELEELVKNSYGLVFGSLACRQDPSRSTLQRLLSLAPLRIFDVNFRPPFYERALVESLLHQSDIAKLNDEELAIILSWYPGAPVDERGAMAYVRSKFDLRMLVVTRGAQGAACQDAEGFHESEGFVVQVQDTVGSGDAFLSGFLKNMFNGVPSAEALRYACALGALVATHKGANPVIRAEEIQSMLQPTQP